MKLLLTSNGLLNTSLEKDFLEMVESRSHLKIAIIPTASDPIEWVPEKEGDEVNEYIARLIPDINGHHEKWLISYQKEWEKRGFTVVFGDLKGDPVELRNLLESVDIIDVLGGDVNWLLDWAKKSKLDTYLPALLKGGLIYIGTSAGSMLVTHDIGLSWWRPEWKLDHVGLGVVDFLVVPHQKEIDEVSNHGNLIQRRQYLQSIIHFPWEIYLLQDGQAMKVIDDSIEHIGFGTKQSIL